MTILSIPDMTCGHCKASVEAALAPITGHVNIDLTERTVDVGSPTDMAVVFAALSAIGFPAQVLAK